MTELSEPDTTSTCKNTEAEDTVQSKSTSTKADSDGSPGTIQEEQKTCLPQVVASSGAGLVPGIASELEITQKKIRDTFAQIDGDREKKGLKGKNLAGLWDELRAFSDANELIRLNIQQMQVHFQEAQQAFWARQAQADEALDRLADNGEDGFDRYQKYKSRFDEETRKDRKMINDLAKTIQKLAAEYRQCALSKKWVVHMAKVQQLKMVVEAAIHRHVHDQATLNKIAEDISDSCRQLFPVSADSEYV